MFQPIAREASLDADYNQWRRSLRRRLGEGLGGAMPLPVEQGRGSSLGRPFRAETRELTMTQRLQAPSLLGTAFESGQVMTMTKSKAPGAALRACSEGEHPGTAARGRGRTLSPREQTVEEGSEGARRLGGVWGGKASPVEEPGFSLVTIASPTARS